LLRQFTDQSGVIWQVWDVHGSVEPSPDWLCFESLAQRRQLTPIPADWTTADVPTLCRYLAAAEVTRLPFSKRR
jgi:hypothetical protein